MHLVGRRVNHSGLISDGVNNLDRVTFEQRFQVNRERKWMLLVVASNSNNRSRRILLAVAAESELSHFQMRFSKQLIQSHRETCPDQSAVLWPAKNLLKNRSHRVLHDAAVEFGGRPHPMSANSVVAPVPHDDVLESNFIECFTHAVHDLSNI